MKLTEAEKKAIAKLAKYEASFYTCLITSTDADAAGVLLGKRYNEVLSEAEDLLRRALKTGLKLELARLKDA